SRCALSVPIPHIPYVDVAPKTPRGLKILVGPSVARGSAARVHVLVVDLVPTLPERYDLGLALGVTAPFLGLSTSPQRRSTTCSTVGFPAFGVGLGGLSEEHQVPGPQQHRR